jgi:hypothetical protein
VVGIGLLEVAYLTSGAYPEGGGAPEFTPQTRRRRRPRVDGRPQTAHDCRGPLAFSQRQVPAQHDGRAACQPAPERALAARISAAS